MCAIQRFDAVLITEQLDHPDLAPWLLHSLGVRADAWDESDVVAGLPPVVSTTAAIPHSRLGVNKVRNNRGNDGDGGVLEPPREIRGELEQQNAYDTELYLEAKARLSEQLSSFRNTQRDNARL